MSGSAWLLSARALTNLLGIVSTVLLARLLLPSDFGLVAIAMTVLAIVSSLTELSLSQALIQHPSPSRDHLNTAWTINVIRGLIVGATLAVSADLIATVYSDPRIENVLYVLALNCVLLGLANPKSAILNKDLIFWQSFIVETVAKVFTVSISVSIAAIYHSYWALVLGLVFGQLSSLVISYLLIPFLPRPRLNKFREFWSFSIWITLGQAINTINWRFDQLIVGGLLGKTALGYYAVGDNLAQMPTREAVAPLSSALFPGLTKLADDRDRLSHAYQKAQSFITFVALPIGVGFALISEPVVILAMGSKWLAAVPVIQGLSAIFALQTIGSMVAPLAMAKGRTKKLFFRDAQMFAIRLPIIIAGTYYFGIKGLIASRILTGLIAILFNVVLVRHLTGLTLKAQISANYRSLISVLVMAAAVIAFDTYFLSESTSVLGGVYAILYMIIVGALTYAVAAGTLWYIAGLKEGPESELLKLLKLTLSKVTGLVLK